MKFKPDDFRLGDIIEFQDASFRDSKWTINDKFYVGRIDCIIKNEFPLRPGIDHPVELWLEYYCEMNGAMYVAPNLVKRIIERGTKSFPKEVKPKFKVGTTVVLSEQKKTLLDKISGYEVRFDEDGVGFSYRMKYSGYLMRQGEFKVEGTRETSKRKNHADAMV